ncbi:Sodium-dependent dopamine transporter [Armadillidium nasatum]|uniref:Sodium-dependent dopamine transporter n=1 Tax=Armadillidium nasatum TaxID=96803 RepID=A0A5N5TMJ7_9CRUS|nr:Sodium-dependent dopamine transporter [Armadillidium nasatum]
MELVSLWCVSLSTLISSIMLSLLGVSDIYLLLLQLNCRGHTVTILGNTPACQEIIEDENIYEEEASYDNVSLLFSSSSSSSSASASGDFSSGDSSSTSTAASSSVGILLDGEFVRPTSPAQEYWLRKVLQQDQSLGLNDLGSLQWETALCLLAVYLICYFSIWKGISTSGKVVWFTALFPYVVLLILLIRGVTLPGAIDGIHYYLKADFSKIWSSEEVLCTLDALVTSTINCLTSFVSGFVIFSVLGYMSKMSGNDIANVVDQGPGLVFVAYPMALATMPWSSFFAIIFFMMLLTLGLDSSVRQFNSQFAGSEAVVTALSDEFPVIGRNREIFVACLFLFDFLVGLACCTQGGYYVFQVFETYAAGISILFAVFCEAIAIAYIYGIPRLFEDVKEMIGFSPGIYWRTSIKYFGPFFIGFIIINGLVSHKPLSSIDSEKFPWWTDWLGWTMAGSSMLLIPGVAIYKICTTKGTFMERIRYLCIPWRDQQVTTSNGVTVDSDQVKLNSPIGNAHQV